MPGLERILELEREDTMGLQLDEEGWETHMDMVKRQTVNNIQDLQKQKSSFLWN